MWDETLAVVLLVYSVVVVSVLAFRDLQHWLRARLSIRRVRRQPPRAAWFGPLAQIMGAERAMLASGLLEVLRRENPMLDAVLRRTPACLRRHPPDLRGRPEKFRKGLVEFQRQRLAAGAINHMMIEMIRQETRGL